MTIMNYLIFLLKLLISVAAIVAFLIFLLLVPAKAIHTLFSKKEKLKVVQSSTYLAIANIILSVATIISLAFIFIAISITVDGENGVLFMVFNSLFFNGPAFILLVFSEIFRNKAYKNKS